MELSTLRRRVKRQFGDEYNVIINDQDIIDWCNEAQSDIVRDTTDNDVTVTVPANQFPYIPVGARVTVKRVAINNRAVYQTTINDLDTIRVDPTSTGTPLYWYYENGQVNLYPTPAVADVYNVLVTYTILPTELHYLDDYFNFVRVPQVAQVVSTPAKPAFKQASLNIIVDIQVGNISVPFTIASNASAESPANTVSWVFSYQGGNNFRLLTSNNTNLVTRNLALTGTAIANGDRLRMRVIYDGATGTLSFFRIDAAGVETAAGSVVGTVETLNTTADLPMSLGAVGTIAGSAVGPFRLYEFQYSGSISAAYYPVVQFFGSDLIDIPTLAATGFESTSGHDWTIAGDPTPLVLSTDALTVPEIFHQDVLQFCLAKAYDKNMNYKASSDAMEKYQQNVTLRRYEADTTDTAQYKQQDPMDFDGYVDGNYY